MAAQYLSVRANAPRSPGDLADPGRPDEMDPRRTGRRTPTQIRRDVAQARKLRLGARRRELTLKEQARRRIWRHVMAQLPVRLPPGLPAQVRDELLRYAATNIAFATVEAVRAGDLMPEALGAAAVNQALDRVAREHPEIPPWLRESLRASLLAFVKADDTVALVMSAVGGLIALYQGRRGGRSESEAGRPNGAAGQPTALPYFAYRTAVNAQRYVAGLRPFGVDDFGHGPNAPSRGHLDAVNRLIAAARKRQELAERALATRAQRASAADGAGLAALLKLKEAGETQARETEQLWEFYLNLFGQRLGPFAGWLGALDRVALDCYQAVYLGLGKARSIPSPAPLSYMEAGFGPATYRRGVTLGKIGRLANPFPLVKVPYHRLLNPWSLGAVPHEVAHNLQNDLGLWEQIPGRIGAAFQKRGLAQRNAEVWRRWHKETYADLAGVLLIGPSYVGSLMDVVGRSRESTARWDDEAVHPTPIIRTPVNIRLLERIGFGADAAAFRRAWDALYPASVWAQIPEWVRTRLPEQIDAVLDAICFQPCAEYGGRALAEVIRFEPKHAELVREAADRLQTGMDTGVLPERFLIAAARQALAQRRTPPATIQRNFYEALGRC